MNFTGKAIPLTQKDAENAAAFLGTDLQTFWTIVRVETKGVGFLPDKRPQILFERHVFRMQLMRAGIDTKHMPIEICYSIPGEYGAEGAHQYDRLDYAMHFSEQAALKSASWGIGQIMGFNAAIAGYSNVNDMITDFCNGECFQLAAMAQFINSSAAARNYLVYHDWDKLAAFYNGRNYKINKYVEKLVAAYKMPLPDFDIRAKQIECMFAGIDPGPIDGRMGKLTESAIRKLDNV